ncbi:hypothetical protein [Paraburkholderia phytofirmans]|nr:hypothetical protein [Paraburkholderia phytofirmans]
MSINAVHAAVVLAIPVLAIGFAAASFRVFSRRVQHPRRGAARWIQVHAFDRLLNRPGTRAESRRRRDLAANKLKQAQRGSAENTVGKKP